MAISLLRLRKAISICHRRAYAITPFQASSVVLTGSLVSKYHGMGHRKEEHTALHVAAMHGIEDGARSQARFASSDFPRRLFDSCRIHHLIPRLAAHDKTSLEAAKSAEPGSVAIAAIKDMDESLSPALRTHP